MSKNKEKSKKQKTNIQQEETSENINSQQEDQQHSHSCNCGSSCKSEEQDYLELAQRIKAEFENYKKRNAEIAISSYHNGIGAVVKKLLPALDSFQQAKSNITDVQVISGLDLIYNQILEALGTFGVSKIDCLGKVFDPNFHDAVLVDKNKKYEDNTILEEYQAGFTMNDKVIRPSSVKINKL